MDAIRDCCAGLDVHQATVVACVLKGPLESKPKKEIREFPTVLSGLLELLDWLEEKGCKEIAMESTGVYWKPVYNVLEVSCNITLANAAHIKNVPGRKTDIMDAQWIAQLHRCGLIRGSFIAPREIRELRDLTRYRKKLKGYETSEKNRIIKVLEDANIKVSTYMSNVFGVSGRKMLEALINGETIEPTIVADLAIGRLRSKIPDLIEALNGRVTKHHRNIIKMSLNHLMYVEQSVAELEAEMEQYFAPYNEELELLNTIPGVGSGISKIIIAEIGNDMSIFPSAAHISSWAGLSPGNKESAGKKKQAPITRGNKALKTALIEAAWSASRTRTFLGSKFWSMKGRKGNQKAAVAIAHKILIISYYILRDKVPYNELGTDFLEKRRTTSKEELMIRRLKNLGYTINKEESVTA